MVFEMKRLTAYVSGKVQKAGYRARVKAFARAFGLKGLVQNLDDGRVKITAEGEDAILEQFLKAIGIKNTVIYVDSISKDYSEATGEYTGFHKIVDDDETDSRLDSASSELNKVVGSLDKVVAGLNDVVGAIKDMHADLGSKQDKMLEKQDQTLVVLNEMNSKQDKMLEKQDQTLVAIKDLGCKIDDSRVELGNKIDGIGSKIDDTRADIVGEVRELRKDIKDGELVQMKNDIAEIKIKLKLQP
jgi:acylphosphatase